MSSVKVKVVGRSTTLTLSTSQLSALIVVLNRVGGRPDTTRRGDISDILDGMAEAGINTDDDAQDVKGDITFGRMTF